MPTPFPAYRNDVNFPPVLSIGISLATNLGEFPHTVIRFRSLVPRVKLCLVLLNFV